MDETVKMTLKGKPFTFTALSFKQLRALRPQFQIVKGIGSDDMPNDEQITAIAEICATSLSDQHAGITAEAVEDMLTLATVGDAMKAVAGISGLVKAPTGE